MPATGTPGLALVSRRCVGDERPRSEQRVDRLMIHVVEALVLAGHRPDEAVGLSADTGVDRPARRDDGLIVGDDQVAGLVRVTHQVHHASIVGNVEIQIALGAAIVGVGGHGVPHAAGVQLGQAHDDLARLDAVLVDIAVQGAAIGVLLIAQLADVTLTRQHRRGRIAGVRRRTEEVEERLLVMLGGEADVADTASDVQAAALGQFVPVAVGGDHAGATNDEHAHFAALQEVVGPHFLGGLQPQRLVDRGGAAQNHAILMTVNQDDLVVDEQIRDEEVGSQFLGVHAGRFGHADRMTVLHVVEAFRCSAPDSNPAAETATSLLPRCRTGLLVRDSLGWPRLRHRHYPSQALTSSAVRAVTSSALRPAL
ncbi:hypothetical protein SDC9_87792 [bioreactor metagenome]|uniref:Uncharacterized protein n=1 Tax=bioreactor metagenome TaxID=1076179 RepID=A0A644ZJT6_9ZZZZ